MDIDCHIGIGNWIPLPSMGADPDLDLTILSLSPNPGAGTIALASVIREAAFLHIPSSVVYGSLILVTVSFSNKATYC